MVMTKTVSEYWGISKSRVSQSPLFPSFMLFRTSLYLFESMDAASRLRLPIYSCPSKQSQHIQKLLPLFVFHAQAIEVPYKLHERSRPLQRRHVHNQPRRHVSSSLLHLPETASTTQATIFPLPEMPVSKSPLSCLPLSTLV